MSIPNGDLKLDNQSLNALPSWNGLPPVIPPRNFGAVPAPWELPPPHHCPIPGLPQLTHEQAMAFQQRHILASRVKNKSLLPEATLPDQDYHDQDYQLPGLDSVHCPMIKEEEMDLSQYHHIAPIRADLVIGELPSDVEEELQAQKRKRRIPDEPIDLSLPPRKRQKMERMKKNRESAQKSREKKARHRAMLSEQVKLLSMKNTQLTNAITVLSRGAEEADHLRTANSKLQMELYEVKLANERLQTRLQQQKRARAQQQSNNTINITNCVSSTTTTRNKHTGVTETSNCTDSAVGKEASHGTSKDATSSAGGFNVVKQDSNGRANPCKGEKDCPASADKMPNSFAEFAASKLKGSFGGDFSFMAGSLENKLAVFNDLIENTPWPIPDLTGSMGMPPVYSCDAIFPQSPMAPIQSVN